mmetsp:Transcript_5689/g.6728  ORF Transcript_5689/g.6728 Transcript_5689/m.6728 type:complete len:487 (+) Transcript_5689:194-1654(+)
MNVLKSEKNKDLVSQLESCQLCKCCQFRALSGIYEDRYAGPSVTELCTVDVDIYTGVDSEKAPTLTCPVCFGILQRVNEVTKALIDSLTSSGYEASSYRLTASIPLSSRVRERILEEKLSVKFKYELKDMLRSYLKEGLRYVTEGNWSKIDYSMTAGLVIDVGFQHIETDFERNTVSDLLDKGRVGQGNPNSNPRGGNGKRRRSDGNKVSNSQFVAIMKRIPKHDFIACFPPECPKNSFTIENITISREPVYISGRYIKLARGMSQTPWILDGVRKGDLSVEESVSPPLVCLFKSESSKFSASGREDVDVRMLGKGRPFVLQLLNAKIVSVSEDDLKAVEKQSEQSDVHVNSIKIDDSSCMETRRENEMEKKKNYVCVVWVSKKLKSTTDLAALNRDEDLVIKQATPLRVLHRRTLLNRDKIIHSAKTEIINDHFFILRLCASAGTYIKEFVHGDRGRTMPNVGSLLGCEADILQLDVESLVLKGE